MSKNKNKNNQNKVFEKNKNENININNDISEINSEEKIKILSKESLNKEKIENIGKLKNEREELEKEKQKFEQEKKEFEKEKSRIKDIKNLEEEYNKLKEEKKYINSEKEKIKERETNSKKEYEEYMTKKLEYEKKINQFEDEKKVLMIEAQLEIENKMKDIKDNKYKILKEELTKSIIDLTSEKGKLSDEIKTRKDYNDKIVEFKREIEIELENKKKEEIKVLKDKLKYTENELNDIRKLSVAGDTKVLLNKIDKLEKLKKELEDENEKLKEDLEKKENKYKNEKEELRKTLEKTIEEFEKQNENIKRFNELELEKNNLEMEKENFKNLLEMSKANKNYLESEINKYKEDIARLSTKEGEEEDRDARIKQIKGTGLDYSPYSEEYEIEISEKEWLNKILKASEDYGIKLNERIVYAFHTALKISDWSIITILAGVSGTGKSELPKLYARFGGLNFINIPVQPNWDSQESMLGYFNSIDNRFDAQPLLSFLMNVTEEEKYNEYPSVILLDEMNLSHIEHYFADFLSKLEERRGKDEEEVPTIEIKLGVNHEPFKLKLSKSLLWVGTMNQDETTHSLSDKVIDRGEILYFPRPKNLVSKTSQKLMTSLIKEHEIKMLNIDNWNLWIKNREDDEHNTTKESTEIMDKYKEIVESINNELGEIGRGLGHRVWQTIENYIYNYPTVDINGESEELEKNMKIAFEDQIVQKIMPKLRGIEVRNKGKESLERILSILRDNGFNSLDKDYKSAMELGFGQFMWNSANYLEKNDKK